MTSDQDSKDSTAFSEGYGSQFHSVISKVLDENLMLDFCVNGGLRTTSLRSVIWRVLLKCLPVVKSEWISVLDRTRASYEDKKKIHLADPHDDDLASDPNQFNPLAQTEQNPWQKYFADHEIRDLIAKDVDRTCPEILFFQDKHIQSIMRDILLVYAKEHPCTSYKQGMHEVLAPLLFVLNADQESYYHAKESTTFSDDDLSLLECIYNRAFLEHDAYAMFCEIMLEICKWYDDGSNVVSPSRQRLGNEVSPRKESSQTSQLMRDLVDMENLLLAVDPELSKHLSRLEVSPQLYGIRWLRLLFGREFPMHDLLFIWDVILSERPFVRTLMCIAIALMQNIRELLLNSDQGGCLQYLLRMPPVFDISAFVQLVRHYRSPNRVSKPVPLPVTNFASITVSGSTHPNVQTRGDVIGFEEPPSAFRPKSRSVLDKVKDTILDRPSTYLAGPTSPRRPQRNISSPSKSVSGKKDTVNNWDMQVMVMENQVACLQTQVNDNDVMCAEVARLLDMCAQELLTATTEESRKALSTKIALLGKRLIGNGVRRGIPADPIELGREFGSSGSYLRDPFVKVKKNNEMVEFKSSNSS